MLEQYSPAEKKAFAFGYNTEAMLTGKTPAQAPSLLKRAGVVIDSAVQRKDSVVGLVRDHIKAAAAASAKA